MTATLVERLRDDLAKLATYLRGEGEDEAAQLVERADDTIERQQALLDEVMGVLTLFERQWNACGPNSDFGRHFQNVRDAVVPMRAKLEGREP
jgi:hypothetical protein